MTRKTARTTQSPGLAPTHRATSRPGGALTAALTASVLLATIALGVTGARALGAPAPVSASAVSPPATSEYQALPVCHAPAPGHAACLALALAPRTAAARARTHPRRLTRSAPPGAVASAAECPFAYASSCLTPADLRGAYFSGEQPDAPTSKAEPQSTQTIALVDAYNDPNAKADLKVYDQEFGLPELPACTATVRQECFEQVNQHGEAGNLPSAISSAEKEEAEGWALETSTDIESAHAVCQNCRIVLVEAANSAYDNLTVAENTAVSLGANEISNSWGGTEAELTDAEIAAFNHPGVAITASAGDDGYLNWDQWETEQLDFDEPDYPASSPDVVAVGGTKLTLSAGAWQSETVWNEDRAGQDEGAAGGGCSLRFNAPAWQRGVADWPAVGCEGRRAVADVSADADPTTGVAVYDSIPYPYEENGERKTEVLGWVPIGGTSLASPIVASMFALAGGAHGIPYPAETLYTHLGSALLHDVAPTGGLTAGGNGECDDDYSACSGSMKPLSPFDCGEDVWICNAAVGYDGPTGVGTPNGIAAFRTTAEDANGGGTPESKSGGGGPEGDGGAKGEGEGLGAGAGQPLAGASPSPGGKTGNTQSPSAGAVPTVSRATVRISNLVLTLRALDAIDRGRLTISQIAVGFTLSAATNVRIALARQVLVNRRPRWVSQPGAFTVAAAQGRDRLHLKGHRALVPGRYRVTLTPAHGSARSLAIVLR